MSDITSITQYITDPPIALLLISFGLAIIGAYRGWWIPRFIYDEKMKEIDKLLDINQGMINAVTALTDEIKRNRGDDAR